MAGQLRMYDIGSLIRVRVCENGASLNAEMAIKTLKWKKPSGEVEERAAEYYTDGTADGHYVQYTTVEDDLDECGPWTGQVFLDFAPDGKWHTEPFNFTVGENLELKATAP
jgi:hypothetical protein